MPGRDNGNWWWECKLVNIFKRKLTTKNPDIAVEACDLSTGQERQEDKEVTVILSYMLNSRSVLPT